MHASAMDRMTECIQKYLSKDRHYDVLDFGSFVNKGQKQGLNHRQLFSDYDCTITGVDLQAGTNVDIVMSKPYRIPARRKTYDLVITGQVFEHIPFPWASILEIARVMRTGAYLFFTAPSRGHRHYIYDPWRYYPDSLRSLAAFADLKLLRADTDLPPVTKATGRHNYAGIDTDYRYWGDTTGVFQKPRWRPSPWRVINREVTLARANQLGGLESVPQPGPARLWS